MFGVFLATYGAVFVAEIVGDKLLYTTGVLATRYRSASVVGDGGGLHAEDGRGRRGRRGHLAAAAALVAASPARASSASQ